MKRMQTKTLKDRLHLIIFTMLQYQLEKTTVVATIMNEVLNIIIKQHFPLTMAMIMALKISKIQIIIHLHRWLPTTTATTTFFTIINRLQRYRHFRRRPVGNNNLLRKNFTKKCDTILFEELYYILILIYMNGKNP
jgi:septum formation topological specificity factor MinE